LEKLVSLKNNIYYTDDYIKEILFTTKSIAIVGLSDKGNRPSNFAAKYLKNRGYKIIPINPVTSKKVILGEKVYKTISELNFVPDMVDLFVRKEKILEFVKEAIKIKTKTIWLQLGLIDKESEKMAKSANINFIMNKCPKIEYAKYSGELGWAGINSNVISNKRYLLKND
jgi:predicted CoA-binding protein